MHDAVKIAVDVLENKARELLEERVSVRRRLLEDASRDLQIERDLNGCVAGGRALGYELEVQASAALPGAKQTALQQFVQARNVIASTAAQLKSEYDTGSDEIDDEDASPDPKLEMPRIADIIVDRLQVAGEEGSKSADIRRYILHKYSADIHEKTVGMTLYRLQKDEVVRREGHTWFLSSAGSEEKNPGAGTPGSDQPG